MITSNRSKFARNGWSQCRYALAVVCLLAMGACAEETETAPVIGYIDSLSGNSANYEIARGTGDAPEVRVRTQILEGDLLKIMQAYDTAVIRFTDGSRKELGPVAGWYGPWPKPGSEASPLRNLLTALAGTQSYVRRTDTIATVATVARGEGPIVMGDLFTGYPLVLVEGRRTFFLRWGGGDGPYQVRLSRISDDAAIFSVDQIETQHFRSQPINLSAGDYAIEVTDADNIFRFNFLVATVNDLPDEIPIANVPDTMANYLEAYVLAVADENTWAFESYQRLAELARQGYEPASLLLNNLEKGKARYWQIPDTAQ